MAYNKEYYDANKDKFKAIRDRYRHNPTNKKKINAKQREKYKNMPEDKKKELSQKNKEDRAKNVTKSRIQYRINQKKRLLNKYLAEYNEYAGQPISDFVKQRSEEGIAWNIEEHKEVQELFAKMAELQEKIDKKNEEILILTQEMESLK